MILFCILYKVNNNLFLHQSYYNKKPTSSQINWWKIQKIIFYYWKNLKTSKVLSTGWHFIYLCTRDSILEWNKEI